MDNHDRLQNLPLVDSTPMAGPILTLAAAWVLLPVVMNSLVATEVVDVPLFIASIAAAHVLTVLAGLWLVRVDAKRGVAGPRSTYPLVVVLPPVGLLRYLVQVGKDR